MLAGHSQGGRAALFAAEIAAKYAPELHLLGVATLAPGVELPALVDHLASSPAKATALMGAIGLRAAYPDLDLATVFTPNAISDMPRIETGCVNTTVARYQSVPANKFISRDPSSVTDVGRILEENSPGTISPTVPIFIGHSEADEQVPVDLSARLMANYCALGATVIRRTYPGQDHAGVIGAANDAILSYIADRYDHRRATNSCS